MRSGVFRRIGRSGRDAVRLGTLVLLFALASACASHALPDPTGSPTSSPSTAPTPAPATATPAPTPTRVPTPTPTKTPFLWKLLANGSAQFVQVTGAPVGSVCTPKAMLRSGKDISGHGLNSQTVTNAVNGVTWSSPPLPSLLNIPSPSPSSSDAYWQVTCTNPGFNPPNATVTVNFSIS
jgi:hypothetical protein